MQGAEKARLRRGVANWTSRAEIVWYVDCCLETRLSGVQMLPGQRRANAVRPALLLPLERSTSKYVMDFELRETASRTGGYCSLRMPGSMRAGRRGWRSAPACSQEPGDESYWLEMREEQDVMDVVELQSGC